MGSQLAYYTNYINYTQQAEGLTYTTFQQPLNSNSIVLFITSLWIRATFASKTNNVPNPIQLHIYTGIFNESFYWWNLTLKSQVLITNIHFS